MNVYYDKSRKKWDARVNYQGKRYCVGRFRTKKQAEAEARKYEKELKKMDTYTLDSYKPSYIKPRKNKNWLNHAQSWFSRVVERWKATRKG